MDRSGDRDRTREDKKVNRERFPSESGGGVCVRYDIGYMWTD